MRGRPPIRSLLPALACVVAVWGCRPASGADTPRPELRDGDIVLQRSLSSQSEMLRVATGSPWTHVAIVFGAESDPRVLEAVGPVRYTDLDAWADRGEDGEIVVLRLQTLLSTDTLERVRAEGEAVLGAPYDLRFAWGDDEIYCSELVYKAFERGAGIELGELSPLGSFAITSPVVQQAIEDRWGDDFDPDEPAVAPGSLLEDGDLVEVYRGRW